MDCTFENCTFVELFFHNTDFDGVRFQLVNILPSSLCLLSNHSEGTVTLEDVTMNASVVEFQEFNISELRTSLQLQVESVCSEDLYSDLVCRSDDLHFLQRQLYSFHLRTFWKHLFQPLQFTTFPGTIGWVNITATVMPSSLQCS